MRHTENMDLEYLQKQAIQEDEYCIPYHYQDIFAPGQSIERNSILETVIGFLNLDPQSTILDIGCGDGRFCYYAKNICHVEGIDISDRALEWATVFNPGVIFHKGPLQSLFRTEPYDGLVCIEVLEHIPDYLIPSLLEKAKAILKPDGKFILTVPSVNLPLQDKHFRHYDEGLLHSTLSPYFDVKIHGHSRVSRYHKIMSLLNAVSLLFYSENFREKHPRFVEMVSSFKKNFWYKHLHSGLADECYRLIAVCTQKIN